MTARYTAASIPAHVARMMRPEDRKAAGIVLPEEAQAKHEARQERELQTLCERELNRRGIAYLHLSPRARERAGWPDLVFVVEGIPYAVELKTAAGRLTPEQRQMLQGMAANGWRTHVVRDFESFHALLTHRRRHEPIEV